MSFLMQLPNASDLAETIQIAAVDSLGGGGMFAFASRRGIERFFAIRSVRELLEAGRPFVLIVGTDAITNADALLCIEELATRYRSFRAFGFVHDSPTTFHPKLCWFTSNDAATLVVGSGNLTSSGLGGEAGPPRRLGNWEALVSQSLKGRSAWETVRAIDEWIDSNIRGNNLLPISHEDVRARGVANSRVKYVRPSHERRGHQAPPPRRAADRIDRIAPPVRHTVLVREIPLNRSGQADITKAGLEFFGFIDEPKKVLIQNVGLNNVLGEVVERLLFVNASRNYRIEITEVAEQEYIEGPDDGRMVLVAVKLDDSAFRYTVVPVSSPHYRAMNKLLGPVPATGRRLMRLLLTDIPTLRHNWPRIPENLLPVVAISVEDVD
nr:phospholipase D family protein [Luteibacter rhizovicinus]